MNTQNLFQSLYKYKAWSESKLFEVLKASDHTDGHANLHSALWHLAHINIVDNLFISRLLESPTPCTTTTTEKAQEVEILERRFTEANQWFIEYTSLLTPFILEKRVSFIFADGKPGNMTKAEMLTHVISHGLQHRGMVNILLPSVSDEGWEDHYTTFLRS